jgi:hypothetical protein
VNVPKLRVTAKLFTGHRRYRRRCVAIRTTSLPEGLEDEFYSKVDARQVARAMIWRQEVLRLRTEYDEHGRSRSTGRVSSVRSAEAWCSSPRRH